VQAAAYLGDAARAAVLYELLKPYGGGAIHGFGTCMGPTSGHLGRLAATMGRWAEAEQHFEDALAMSARMGARPWTAWIQRHYARMLMTRNEPGDRTKALSLANEALAAANEFGMQPILRHAIELKLELQGLTSESKPTTSIDFIAAAVEVERPDLSGHAAPDGTVTILFSDIENFTSLTERMGDLRAQELLRVHNTIVRKQISAHNGYEVKSEGDGFMLAFTSARRAITCAIDMQRDFALFSRQKDHPPIHVRMGLHTGEVIREADDFFGKNVIVASRIADQAQGGKILVSSMVRELTSSAGDLVFDEGRNVQLKGLSGTYRIHEVLWSIESTTEAAV
ncbi:MAG: tetratricopeptide repeat protein, partial [Candidatus Hydrogenedentota bacterium]